MYSIPNDRNLLPIIEKARQQNLKLGTDFSIISYNETPLKKVVSNGITTISTDFSTMGKLLVQMVLTGKKNKLKTKAQPLEIHCKKQPKYPLQF